MPIPVTMSVTPDAPVIATRSLTPGATKAGLSPLVVSIQFAGLSQLPATFGLKTYWSDVPVPVGAVAVSPPLATVIWVCPE